VDAQIYRFRDFTGGDPLASQFADALRELLEDSRFDRLSVAQVVGAMDVVKMELVLQAHGVL